MTTELTFDEPRDVLPDEWDTLAVRVSSDGSNLALEFLGPSDNIFRKRISCQLSERRPFHQRRHLLQSHNTSTPTPPPTTTITTPPRMHKSKKFDPQVVAYQVSDIEPPETVGVPHLAIEGDWRLIEPRLLRVTDVRGYDLVKWQIVYARLESHSVFFGFDSQLAAHGVLYVEYRRVQRIDCESSHRSVSAIASTVAADWNTR